MHVKKLIQPLIGATGFILKNITVNPEMSEIIIDIRPTKREECQCSIC